MQSGLSQPSPVVLSGTALHNFPTVQHQELAKAQSSLAFQQTSNTQPIPILYEHQLGQASGLGGSQLIDTHLLQVRIFFKLRSVSLIGTIMLGCKEHYIKQCIGLYCSDLLLTILAMGRCQISIFVNWNLYFNWNVLNPKIFVISGFICILICPSL